MIHLRLVRDPVEWACCLAVQPALKAWPFTASEGQQDGKELKLADRKMCRNLIPFFCWGAQLWLKGVGIFNLV